MTLTVHEVSKTFGATSALKRVSLDAPTGTRLALVGASGSGKSTLLRLIAGFDHPDSGEVHLDSRILSGGGTIVPAHRRGIGHVAQDGALFPHLTVRQNIAFGLQRGSDRDSRVRDTLRMVQLDERLIDRYPHALSGGQQKRVALARALAPQPRAILLDEPFSALDSGLREQTRLAVVDALDLAGVTTILVTHDQNEALSFGHSIGVLAKGELLQFGEPGRVFDDPSTAEVASFLGAALFLTARRERGGVLSALGSLEVRHDHAAADEHLVRAMVRPSQITVYPGADQGNAVIEAVRPRGAELEVSLVLADSREPVVLRMPAHAFAGSPGGLARVGVAGGVVVYPRL